MEDIQISTYYNEVDGTSLGNIPGIGNFAAFFPESGKSYISSLDLHNSVRFGSIAGNPWARFRTRDSGHDKITIEMKRLGCVRRKRE